VESFDATKINDLVKLKGDERVGFLKGLERLEWPSTPGPMRHTGCSPHYTAQQVVPTRRALQALSDHLDEIAAGAVRRSA